MARPKPRYLRQEELRAKVLADLDWTARVVAAAIVASDVLEGPMLTDDGDASAMVARTRLRSALADLSGLNESLAKTAAKRA